MNIPTIRTHVIVALEPYDIHTAPGSVRLAVTGAEKATAKAGGLRHWGETVAVVALDDENEDARWKGAYRTPREFFNAEYDDAGVPRAWIVRNAQR